MKFNPYVIFNDSKCEEALTFYEKVFQVKNLGITRFGDMETPEHPIPEAAKQLVANTALEVEENTIMFSDSFPGSEVKPGDNVSISISSTDLNRLTAIYHDLKEDGKIFHELQETYWSPAYASLIDKYGVFWQINTERT